MGRDLLVGDVYIDLDGPVYHVEIPQISGPGDGSFEVYRDREAVRWSDRPESEFRRLPNGMYIWNRGDDDRFWKNVYTALKVNTRLPISRYMPAGPKRDALEREIKRRGGAARVREGTSSDGLYFHDEMLADLAALIDKGLKNPKWSDRASCRCPAPKKPAKRAAKR